MSTTTARHLCCGARPVSTISCLHVGKWNPDVESRNTALSLIQEVERVRVNRFRREMDFKRGILGRLLLRDKVSTRLNVAPTSLVFDRTKEGKPFLNLKCVEPEIASAVMRRLSYFNFNLTHHGDWVVYADHNHCLVGVDVMKFERPKGVPTLTYFFQVMRSNLTEQEWLFVTRGPEIWSESASKVYIPPVTPQNCDGASRGVQQEVAESITGEDEEQEEGEGLLAEEAGLCFSEWRQLQRFYLLWTLKEAFIKAVGVGLGQPPGELDLRPNFPSATTGTVPAVEAVGEPRDGSEGRAALAGTEAAAVVVDGDRVGNSCNCSRGGTVQRRLAALGPALVGSRLQPACGRSCAGSGDDLLTPLPDAAAASRLRRHRLDVDWRLRVRGEEMTEWSFHVYRLDSLHVAALALGPVDASTASFAHANGWSEEQQQQHSSQTNTGGADECCSCCGGASSDSLVVEEEEVGTLLARLTEAEV